MVKVFLDPGHGGSDPGATANGLKEKDLTLKIAEHTRNYLQSNYKGVTVKMSRTGDTYPSLTGRANDANNWGADVFVSVHINAGGGVGYEDYIYNGSVSAKTKDLQNKMHSELSPLFSTNRGKKRANLAVVRQSKMPAILTENGFIDNKGDADFLKKDANLKKLGQAHAKGIAVFLGLDKGSSKPSEPEKQTGNARIRTIQSTVNNRYNAKIKVDGFDGPETKKALIMGLQTELNKQFKAGLNVDGLWGPKTANACVTVKKGARGNLTWLIQARLHCLGYDPKGLDSIFGNGLTNAVTAFQKTKKIGADGVPGKATFAKLFG